MKEIDDLLVAKMMVGKLAEQNAELVAALDALFKESSELSPFAGKASVRSVRQAGKFMKAWRNARDVLAKVEP